MRVRSKYTNRAIEGYKVKKMNDETYSLRRKVIDVLYQIKRRGYKIPRIEVRIVNGDATKLCGYAYTNENVVHIVDEWTKVDKDVLTHLVLHEVVHAVTGFGHDDECYLMNPYIASKVDINESWEAFSKYID